MYPFEYPAVLGSDGAGVVESLGSEVANLKVGDRMYANDITSVAVVLTEYMQFLPRLV